MARVLIVNRDIASRRQLVDSLESRGHDVLCAASGSEGLELARASSVDVVLADVLEPALRDLDFGRNLRRADPASKPLLMHPVNRFSELLRSEAMDAGADIVCSDDPSNVCERIESLLELDRTTDAVGAADVLDQLTALQDQLGELGGISKAAESSDLSSLRWKTNARLTASVAHDVNQPLAAIKNLAWACQRLIADLNSAVGDDLSDHHDQISQAASRAGAMVRSLAHHVCSEGEIETLPIQKFLDRVLDLIELESERVGVAIRRAYRESEPAVVQFETTMLQTVLISRLQESISALAASSSDERWLEVAVETRSRDVFVTLRDNRTARSEDCDPIFTFGFRFDGADRERIERVSRSVIESHGGGLVDDQPVDGGEFGFWLPLYTSNCDA